MDGIEPNWVRICFKVQKDGGQSTCIELKDGVKISNCKTGQSKIIKGTV